jgi:hypothetical protein
MIPNVDKKPNASSEFSLQIHYCQKTSRKIPAVAESVEVESGVAGSLLEQHEPVHTVFSNPERLTVFSTCQNDVV